MSALGLLTRYGLARSAPAPNPPLRYDHYRLLVTANNGDTYLGISEVSLYDAVDGASRSPNSGVATASSESDGSNAAANAFDDNTNTNWRSALGAAYPQWVAKAFAAPITLTYYAINNWNGGTAPSRAPRAWTLQGSDDGLTWTTIDSRSDQTDWTQTQRRAFLPDGANAPRYRLLVTANNGDTYLGISEIELYAAIGGPRVPPARLELSYASGQLSAPEDATKAFDGDAGTSWRVAFASGPQWVAGVFPTALTVAQYGVRNWHTSVNAAQRAPKDWKLQRSDDGITWTNLHTVTGETGWTQGELRKFTL